MKRIKLTRGKYALVDDEDFKNLSQFNWCISFYGYAVRRFAGSKSKIVWMHREIMNPPKEMEIDHKDNNPLNNQKSNLRIATHSENSKNHKLSKNNKVGYKGIHWREDAKKWRTQIIFNYKKIHLGYFKDKKEAALIYNQAAKKYFGQFAKLNVL